MAHYLVKLDETYFNISSGNLILKNVLAHNTGGYIINPTTLNTNGLDKNSVLSKAQLDGLFQILNPPDMIVASSSDFALSNWTALGWGSTLADVTSSYETFIGNHFTSSNTNNPGLFDITTYAVYGTVSGTSYFMPVMAFSNRGISTLSLVTGREPFINTTGLTQTINSSFDDANFKTDNLPFSWYFFGTDYASSVYVGSNTYLTFGYASTAYSGLSASNPGRAIHVGSADNSYQRVWNGVRKLGIGSSEKTTYAIRYEGNGSTSGTIGRPGIVIQYTFFNEQKLNISVGVHNQLAGQLGITNGTAYTYTVNGGGSWTLSQNTSYALSSDSLGNNWVVYPGKFWAYTY